MTPAEVTALAGVVVSLFSAVFVPIYLVRRSDARAARERALSGSEVSWEAINRAIVKERDDLRRELKQASVEYSVQLKEMREGLAREAADVKQRHDFELARANERIKQLSDEVDRLYRRLYQQGNPGTSPPGVD